VDLEPQHYIAFGQYTIYSISNHSINIQTPNEYDYELGYLYDYDLARAVYDPELGNSFKITVESLNQVVSSEAVVQYLQYLLNQQDIAGFSTDSIVTTYISGQALSDYITYGQQETYLGVSTVQLMYVEANISTSVAYYITADGTLGFIDLSEYERAKAETGIGFWGWVGITVGAAVVTTLAIVTCGAIIAAAGPLIGMAAMCIATTGIVTYTVAVTIATIAVCTVAVILVTATTAIAVNELAAMITGYNVLAEWMGPEGYEMFCMIVAIADTLFIGMGDAASQAGYTKPERAEPPTQATYKEFDS